MKKKLLILLILVLAVSAVWADKSEYSKYYYSMGLNISRSDFGYHDESIWDEIGLGGNPDGKKIAIGAEIRLNLGYFRLNVTGDFSVLTPQFLYFSGMSDMGIAFDFKNVVGLGLGLGPNMAFIFSSDGGTPQYITPDEDVPIKEASIFYAWVHSPFNYNVTLEAIIGPVMRVGLSYTFPTEFNLEKFELEKLNPFLKGNFDNGKVSFFVLMRMF